MTKLEPNKVREEEIKVVKDQTFSCERALYNSKDCFINNCEFKGEEDGESPLKESVNVTVQDSNFDLRYALWHLKNSRVVGCNFSSNARAPFWYGNQIDILESKIESVKCLRECNGVIVQNSVLSSEEPFWNCNDVTVVDSKVGGFYAFMGCKDVHLNHVEFTGKYSFQYVKKLEITDSVLDTKDAFWHTSNAVIKNSTIKGEYIAWFAKNLTFINCVIESHQPFCYAKNIKFINCEMINCDLSFECSTVKGTFTGTIDSIKNPKRCNIVVPDVGELIEKEALHKVKCKIKEPKNKKVSN